MRHLLLGVLCSCVVYAMCDQNKEKCAGTPVSNRMKFWTPTPVHSQQDNRTQIKHVELPIKLEGGFTVSAGKLGVNQYADPAFWRHLDGIAKPWALGTVDTQFALPDGRKNGWSTRTTALHDNFNEGLKNGNFGVLKQKGSNASRVAIVQDVVNGVNKNVVRLAAESDGDKLRSAVLQTMDLFASGRYEVVARFPQMKGVVYAVWTFHYEHHFGPDHLPPGEQDPQYLPGVSGWESRTNHEIDIEMPASCSGLCEGGGCVAQFNTMNINAYVVTDASGGEGPGYANLCVEAPAGQDFIDDKYHSYAFEWHSGGPSCDPHIDFFFDAQYIGTVDVFIPSRASRLVLGMWPGGNNWVSTPDFKGTKYAYISEVNICPFNEANDAAFPQVYDQPFNHQGLWEEIVLPPKLPGLPPAAAQCPGDKMKCEGSSDRPNGCKCGDDHRICSSGCCDYVSVPGITNGTCAVMSTCTAECAAATKRPFGCKCDHKGQCGTGCCADGVCSLSSSCEDPCGRLVGRPLKCACNLVGQCSSGCCDYDARPGVDKGLCAAGSVCTSECAQSKERPLGCHCDDSASCGTGCCHSGVCEYKDSCPTPSACSQPTNRPVGCPCGHSWDCSTQWCDGTPPKCTDH